MSRQDPARACSPGQLGSVGSVSLLAGAILIAAAAAAPVIATSRPAFAAVTQPTGEMMPNPAPLNEVNIVVQRGFTADTATLDGLFMYRGEMLQPVRDAHTTPGTFSPMCGFTGQLVLRGGGCHVGFGWYNVTPGSTTPPPPNEIYVLVPAQLPRCATPIDPTMACCDDTEFCPLASYNSTQAPQHRWNSPTFSADNIRTDPRYKGGLIGFAMIGGEQCSQTKFSQAELNTASPAGPPTNGAPWVTVLVYQSTANPNAYYLAFEDLPVTTASWKGNGGNDGDFNDFVYYITGLNCDGGGKRCQTGMPGVCAIGTTQCTNGTAIVCKPDVPASAEICDGQDNDCDGVVDQGNPCPQAGQICDRGVCIQQCNDNEFPCFGGLACDEGYCKDPACIGKTCPEGQICAAGVCQGGCDDVVCPYGQVCRIGRCVDPCAGVDCMGGVCENGACVPRCSCRACADTAECAPDGRCLDKGCSKMICGAGTVCKQGLCLDACAGTKCPVGQLCSEGNCHDGPKPDAGTGGVVGTRFEAGVPNGSGGASGGGRDAGAVLDAAGPGGGVASDGNGVARCSCDLSGPSAGALSLLTLIVAIGLLRLRPSRD